MSTPTVLIIEDDRRTGDDLVEVMSRAGFQTELARDGRAGLDRFRALRPDLVIAEHLLPEAGEAGIVGGIRALDHEVPLVVMTSAPSALRSRGDLEILKKPFGRPQLIRAVERALESIAAEAPAPAERSGTLGEDGLSPLLVELLRDGASGVLRMHRDGVYRGVYLLSGLPVFAESNLLSETFGRYLCARGVIDSGDLASVQTYMVEHGLRQGEALVALGILEDHEVYALLRGQVRERVVRCFDWAGAAWTFHPDDGFIDEKLLFPMNPVGLLVEGTARRVGPKALQTWFETHANQTVWPAAELEGFAAYVARLQREPPLLEVLGGAHTVAEIADTLRLVASRTAAILRTLESLGALTVGGLDGEPTAADAVPPVALELVDPRLADASPADDPVARVVFQTYLSTRGGNHHAALGVARDADANTIEQAWLDLSRRFHPDAFAQHADSEVRARAKEVFLRASVAYAALSDPGSSAPPARLGAPSAPTAPGLDAEAEFAHGEALLAAGDVQAARAAFARALDSDPGEPLFEIYLGWATFLAAADDAGRIEGERMLLRGVARDPGNGAGYRFAAELYARTRRPGAAADMAARAARLEEAAGGDGPR